MILAEGLPIPDAGGFIVRLAEAARAETLSRFGNGDQGSSKVDSVFDPVTDADRAAERAMRALIEEHFPDHGIFGEEYPDRAVASPYSWSLDPVDGTRSFICGMPTWTTLIALLEGGSPVLGVIDAPRLGELYLGHGSTALLMKDGQSQPIAASNCREMSAARLSTTDPYLFEDEDSAAFERVRSAVRTMRYGHDGYAYARLAAGTIDLVVETGLKPYDYNALIPVVRASGGRIGDWRGGDDFSAGKVLAAATAELVEQAVALLGG